MSDAAAGHRSPFPRPGAGVAARLARAVAALRGNDRAPVRTPEPGGFVAGSMHPDSLLLVTLDSCRFDTFESVRPPNISAIGPLHRAQAPGHFTFASHAAMFAGFTPGVATSVEPFVNPKRGRIVRLAGGAARANARDRFTVEGETIVDGFRRRGHLTAGTGAVGWFDDRRASVGHLVRHFDHYRFAGERGGVEGQVAWLASIVGGARRPVLAFLNARETHIPYWYDGAPWSRDDNPCRADGRGNDAAECRRRQEACLRVVDAHLAPLLAAFSNATTVVCGDHGDCWGEDGLWAHGFSHPKVLEVPLVLRVRTIPGDAA